MDAATLPRSLPGWIAFLWSRVLFTGAATEPGRVRLVSLVWLILLPAVLLYPCTHFALFEPDESRYAQIPREMAERGDLVLPTLQGEPYLDKPPLLYWLVMASYRIFGVHDWSARLVPALAVHLTVLLTYLFGVRLLGERVAFRGALVLALAPGFLGMGRLLLLDSLLTLWVSLSLFAGFLAVRGERLHWPMWLLAAVACGLGILTKGPVALVLLAVPVALYRPLTGRGVWPRVGELLAFLCVVAVISLPWYLVVAVRVPEFLPYFLWEHNIQRFLTPFAHERGIWFYGPVVLLTLLPTSLLVIPFVRFLCTGREESVRHRSPELGFVLLAALWCVMFFTLSACKLPTYILPALPFFSLALGLFLDVTPWRASRLPTYMAGVTFGLLLLTHLVFVPWYADYRSPMSRPDEITQLCTDPSATVICYPRNCDSVAFYLGRSDLRVYRSKDIEELRYLVRTRPKTVILCTHRHSLEALHELLPPDVNIVDEMSLDLPDVRGVPKWLMRPLRSLMGETALDLSDVAVVQPGRKDVPIPPSASGMHHRRSHEKMHGHGATLSIPRGE
jgi:Dolichyl-phosphate-mannose-protein mannosyltransferase